MLNSSEAFISLSARVGECILVIHFMVKVLDSVKQACFTKLSYIYTISLNIDIGREREEEREK